MNFLQFTPLIFLLVLFNGAVVLADNAYSDKQVRSPAYEGTSFVDSHVVSHYVLSFRQKKVRQLKHYQQWAYPRQKDRCLR